MDAISPLQSKQIDSNEPDLGGWLRSDIHKLVSLTVNVTPCNENISLGDVATVAHDIKGLATTYGFPVLSSVCGALENLAQQRNAGSRRTELVRLHALACQALVNEGYTGETPSPMLSALLVGLGHARLVADPSSCSAINGS